MAASLLGPGRNRRARVTDRLIAAGLLAWAAPDVPWWWRPPGHGAATPVVLGYLALMLAQSVPFLWWRRVPLLAAGLAAAVLAIRTGRAQNPFSASAAIAVGAFGLGAWGGRRTRLAARILTATAVAAAAVVLLTSHGFRQQALPLALLATALGLGEVTAANRDAAAAAARLAHDAERSRFARELHDVISHQLSVIAVQAGAARLASQRDPGVAVRTVGGIEGSRHHPAQKQRLGSRPGNGDRPEARVGSSGAVFPECKVAARLVTWLCLQPGLAGGSGTRSRGRR